VLAGTCVPWVASSLAAQGTPDRQLVDAQMATSGIDFVTLQPHGGAVLTVSAGDAVHRYTFGPDESPWLSLFDAAGEPLADGVYAWELELLPVADSRADLMRSAARNRGDAPEALSRQTGSFALVGGYVADPTLREPGAEPSTVAQSTTVHHEGTARDRGPQLDSDGAVAAGAVESRGPEATTRPEAGRAARPVGLDSDEMVAAGLSVERRDSNE
jgi:hypothetical protein